MARSEIGKLKIVNGTVTFATAVGHVLGMSAEATIDLNLRIRNSSITEFAFTPKRHSLVCFNAIPHLEQPQYAEWVTYS